MTVAVRKPQRMNAAEFVEMIRPYPDEERWELLDGEAMIAEVLSPSTMNNDRGRKLDFHTAIASLRTILIVYQDELRVEAWQREAEGWRREVNREGGAAIDLGDFGPLDIADVYLDVPSAS